MALFPHPDRSREASLEMLQTLRRIAPSKSLLAGTLAARRWNRLLGPASFGSCSSLAFSRFLPRMARLFRRRAFRRRAVPPLATRERCSKTEKMLSVATNKRRVLPCTLRAESNLASMGHCDLLCEHSRPQWSSDKRAMRWMSLTRPVSPRSLRSGFELSLSP